ncbi:hypothetical protein L905_07155 [Agrobacterium sp. TS43]|nr:MULTISPECIES: hypothetical protein [unclassified Agrobacterium]EPR21266.1 hypothetical protein L902_02000 [Agrobacterium radiobacter DSM 30147]KDR88555.1 hypothetical protein K538_15765 [Agrobacterium tumefaciens GW4]KVK59260.1 hypothetical protein L905_07155 [Agrobacterium sp. TS43]KVK62973.1 hypothetical protein L906_17935 [Agrobacterium sp. TS45]KVK49926.1 hypothetical protein L903_18810 [Agrobacterium sp. JL28]
MDRLTMVDNSAREASIEEMRHEISALFEDQRCDMQQTSPFNDTTGAGGMPPAALVDEAGTHDQPAPTAVDPAIATQQQAIAAGSASRTAREHAGASKAA